MNKREREVKEAGDERGERELLLVILLQILIACCDNCILHALLCLSFVFNWCCLHGSHNGNKLLVMVYVYSSEGSIN